MIRPKITHSFDAARYSHRAGVTDCPHCGAQFDYEKWRGNALTLALCEVHGRHGAAVVVSECPKCFKKSWIHTDLDGFFDFQNWPEGWVEAAREERARRCIAAIRALGRSLCWRCRFLTDGSVSTVTRINCSFGGTGSRSGPAETECEKFKP